LENRLNFHPVQIHCLILSLELIVDGANVFCGCSGGSGNFVLSTSLLGYTANGGCVAPMCFDGYGCFYNILNDHIFVAISSWKRSTQTSADKLFYNFTLALEKMQRTVTQGASKI